jgi:hypothetical protein
MPQHSRPATAGEIIRIVGPLDDAVVMRIVATEATAAEVLEAFTWAAADGQIGTELERAPRGVLARVYEILKQEESAPTTTPDFAGPNGVALVGGTRGGVGSNASRPRQPR